MTDNFGYIDAHAHLRLEAGAVEALLARMDANNVERAAVVAGGTISPELLSQHFSQGGSSDVTIDNEAIRQACALTNDRLLPFFFANPLHGPHAYRSAGRAFHGLKLAPIVHGLPFTDERMQLLLDVAGEFGHPVYVHCLPRPGFEVADLAKLAANNPHLSIILGHGGVGHGDFHGISLIARQENIYFEASGTFTHATRVAWKALGARRVLFGSEYPLQDHSVEIQKFACLALSDDERLQIMRTNTLRLLGLADASELLLNPRGLKPSSLELKSSPHEQSPTH